MWRGRRSSFGAWLGNAAQNLARGWIGKVIPPRNGGEAIEPGILSYLGIKKKANGRRNNFVEPGVPALGLALPEVAWQPVMERKSLRD